VLRREFGQKQRNIKTRQRGLPRVSRGAGAPPSLARRVSISSTESRVSEFVSAVLCSRKLHRIESDSSRPSRDFDPENRRDSIVGTAVSTRRDICRGDPRESFPRLIEVLDDDTGCGGAFGGPGQSNPVGARRGSRTGE
jgi:hypothetical protein